MARDNQASKTQKAQRTERMARALDLRVAGLSLAQIGRELGVDESTACRYVKDALAALAKRNDDNAETLRALELERLDKLQRAAERVLAKNHVYVNSGKVVFDGTTKLIDDGPVLAAIDRLVRIAESRRKLMGIDAPAKVEQSGEVRVVVEYVESDAPPPAT